MARKKLTDYQKELNKAAKKKELELEENAEAIAELLLTLVKKRYSTALWDNSDYNSIGWKKLSLLESLKDMLEALLR